MEVKTIFDELEAALKSHDWYFEFSDDQRVWRSGIEHRKLIKKIYVLAVAEDRPKAIALWNEHAPKMFKKTEDDQ